MGTTGAVANRNGSFWVNGPTKQIKLVKELAITSTSRSSPSARSTIGIHFPSALLSDLECTGHLSLTTSRTTLSLPTRDRFLVESSMRTAGVPDTRYDGSPSTQTFGIHGVESVASQVADSKPRISSPLPTKATRRLATLDLLAIPEDTRLIICPLDSSGYFFNFARSSPPYSIIVSENLSFDSARSP